MVQSHYEVTYKRKPVDRIVFMCTEDSALDAVQSLLDGSLKNASERHTNVLLVFGAPNSGKSSFALNALLCGLRANWKNTQDSKYDEAVQILLKHAIRTDFAIAAAQNRATAARMSNYVISNLGVSYQSRPVGTLSAFAFSLISARNKLFGMPSPKLLNGAEQDAILREIVRMHVNHVLQGDSGDCKICSLFNDYFSGEYSKSLQDGDYKSHDSWIYVISQLQNSDNLMDSFDSTDYRNAHNEHNAHNAYNAQNTQDLPINSAFIHQLRDMLARLDEMGIVSESAELQILNSLNFQSHLQSGSSSDLLATLQADLQSSSIANRLRVQWNLAFALRSQYADCVRKKYPNAFRLDSSKLLANGVQILNEIFKSLYDDNTEESSVACDYSADSSKDFSKELFALKCSLPRLLVVDDFHDVTLAGLAFLESLSSLGVRIILTANPDESVQSFRGSYPDYVVEAAQHGVMQAAVLKICDYRIDGVAESYNDPNDPNDYVDSSNTSDLLKQNSRSIPLSLFSSRVSLSIPSLMPTPMPIARRAWKMANVKGAFPIEKIESNSQETENSSVSGDLYRTAREEMDCVIWQIKRAHLDHKIPWKNMAVIAHDNATVRAFGERLRKDGVPVRYSSVTRALREEPFIKALFALIELAQFSQNSVDNLAKDVSLGTRTISSIARFVKSRIKTIMDSPLIDSDNYNCADLSAVEALMRSIVSLSDMVKSKENSPLSVLIRQWDLLQNQLLNKTDSKNDGLDANFNFDNRIFDSNPNPNSTRFSVDSCYLLIIKALIDSCAIDKSMDCDDFSVDSCDSDLLDKSPANQTQSDQTTEIFSVLQKMRPNSVHLRTLMRVFKITSKLSKILKQDLAKIQNSETNEASYILGQAWNLCNCAKKWQIQALKNNDEGRLANDRLDAAMRLFEYANSFNYIDSRADYYESSVAGDYSAAAPTITQFIDQVRQMEIEADSLASVAPVPDSVTLTTPSGSVGSRWDYVWIPAVQQRVWPNTAARSTMFGSETLVNMVLNNRIFGSVNLKSNNSKNSSLLDEYANPNGICVNDRQAIFTGEQRSFLMAITRANRHLFISAVNSDDCVPSDFLYYYLPEIYWRNADGSSEYTDFCEDFAVMDADPRGLVASARTQVARAIYESENSHNLDGNPTVKDALTALNLLKNNGVDSANPENWDFIRKNYGSKTEEKSIETESKSNLITLSPSMVDSLWSCPVCCLLERKFAGPTRGGTAAQFGTLIHETARWASQDEHLDNEYLREKYPQLQAFAAIKNDKVSELPDFDFSFESISALQKKAIEDVANTMIEHYYSICPSDSNISDVKDRYRFIKNDLNVRRALYTIAQYFVGSLTGSNYPIMAKKDEDGVVTDILPALEKSKSAKPTIADVDLGNLEHVYCECNINATFGFDDILNAYNRASKTQTSLEDLYSIMGFLVGGWQNGASSDLRVRIQGRIDRMEIRKLNDNTEQIRLIDYKTGKVPKTQQVFNDLQLICYQLGIVFCNENVEDVKQLLKFKHTKIARSALFHVVYKDSPAQDNGVAENICQPSLFGADGALSTKGLISRYRYADDNRLYELPDIDEQNPADGVSQNAWSDFVNLPMRTKWSLMMISRVFFAASAVKSTSFVVEPKADHKNHCRCLDVCPGCAGKVDTVYEMIEGKNE